MSSLSHYPAYRFTDGSTMPVGTMYCIGKNYADHAREMGGEVPPSPIVFLKPPAAFVQNQGVVRLPSFSTNIHHEVELVVVIGEDCADVSPSSASRVIAGYAVGLDMTLRDLQLAAKERGEPWAVAKGFVTSAPMSEVLPAGRAGAPPSGQTIPFFDVQLHVNDELKQFASTSAMERSVADLVAYCSRVFTLRRGDCIFTGTPAGVGAVKSGDVLRAELSGDFIETIVLTVSVA
jgi:acylpyruvate hydrolase